MAIVIEQVAIAVDDVGETIAQLSKIGFDQWVRDEVTASGFVFGMRAQNRAQIAFNYQMIPGLEVELIHYVEGGNWHKANGLIRTPFLSHLGMHVDDLHPWRNIGFKIAQDVKTTAHTNPDLPKGRHYRYLVLDSRDQLGFDLKLIQRLEHS